MLQHKPKVGEVLSYHNPYGTEGPVDVEVVGFSSKYPTIAVIRPKNGNEQEIIWSFRDGLNKYLSHKTN